MHGLARLTGLLFLFFFASRMGKKIRQRVIWFCQDFGHSGAQKIKS